MEKTKRNKKFLEAVVLSILIGTVAVVSGCTSLGNNQQTNQRYISPPATTPSHPSITFAIAAAAQSAGNLTLTAGKTEFRLPAKATITSHTIKTLSNATFVQPSMRFVLTPLLSDGVQTTDTATVFFEVVPGQQYIYPEAGGTYMFLTEANGVVNARFNNSGNTITQYVKGQLSCNATSSMTVYVNLTLNTDGCSRIDNVYDPISTTIRFYTNAGWSATYTLSFFLTGKIAG